MKTIKYVGLTLIVIMLGALLIVGCGGGTEVKPAEEPVKPMVKSEPPPPPPKKAEPAPEPVATVKETTLDQALKDIFFDFDKYNVRPDQRASAELDASLLKKNPNAKVLVEGHCDERGTSEYNMALGDKRAKAVKDALVSLGIDSKRVDTISYGKEKPFDPGHTEEAWAKNRRGHVVPK